MGQHIFILEPGEWLGEGIITFSSSPEQLNFYTLWNVSAPNASQIQCRQKVEMKEGGNDPVINNLLISELNASSFLIELSNEMIGKVIGKGVIDPKKIAWEFRGDPAFEGFEVYDLQEDHSYHVHAEYVSGDDYRTLIEGRIWKKAGQK